MKARNLVGGLLLLAAVVLVGCGDDDAGTGWTTTGDPSPLTTFIPADSPYIGANIEPIPEAVADKIWAAAEPMLAFGQSQLERGIQELEARDVRSDEQRLALAFLHELDGKLSREGLEQLGLLGDYVAVYGDESLLPVVRIALSDGSALQAALARIEADAGASFNRKTVNGQTYFDVGDEDARVLISAQTDQLVVTLVPATPEAETVIARVIGGETTGNGAADRLAAVNADYGFSPHGTFLMDIPQLVDQVFNGDSPLAAVLFEKPRAELSAVCRQEILAMTRAAPRMLSGYTALSPDLMEQRMVWELRPDLAGELQKITAPMKGLASDDQGAFYFAFGFDFNQLRTFMRDRVAALQAEPFQCEEMADFNAQVDEMAAQLRQPLPPFVGNFQGLRVRVDRIAPKADGGVDAEGMAVVAMTNPQMILGMAQAFVPALAELQLNPDGTPQPLSADVVPVPLAAPHVAMMDHGLAFSIGEGQSEHLQGFLDAPVPSGDGTLAVFSYDSQALAQMQSWAEQMQGSRHQDAEQEAMQAELEAAMAHYYGAFGRVEARVVLSDRGLEMVTATPLN